jgi:ATP-dependent Clp protease ATP-binding subunit ClpX
MDTRNILFICGGAFIGLDKIIDRRLGGKTLGFHAPARGGAADPAAGIASGVEPEDLLAFGLIPEFIGRLPVVAGLDGLTEEELIHVLTDPKHALVKQYAKLLAMDGVSLAFTKDGLRALAAEAMRKGTGARALRSIIESIMLDVMFEAPGRDDIAEVTINRAAVEGRRPPILRRKQDKDAA